MENDQSRIDELKLKIDENKIDLKQIYLSIGEKAAEPDIFSGKDDFVKESLEKLSGYEKQLGEIDIQIEDLHKSFSRISEITDREKEIGEEYSNLEKENRKLMIPIGEAAFLKWRDNPSEEFSKLMKGLEELDGRIVSYDNEIFKLANKAVKKNLLNKIQDRGRISLLKSRKKRTLSAMNIQYRKTGEKIFRKDISYFEKMKNQEVDVFIDNRRHLEELDREISSLKEENARLEKHLKSSFSSSRQKRAEEKLQSERDLVLSEKMAALNVLGSFLHEKSLSFDNSELKTLFKAADEVLEQIEAINKDIEKCKAELEIVKLDEEISEMKKNIKELQSTIEKCNGDIAEFNKEIKCARAEIRKLKKLTEEKTVESDK